MNRRVIIAYSGLLFTTFIAGCSEFRSSFGGDEEREYAIGVYNYSDDSRTFRVAIEDTPGREFHTETVELDAQTADETIPFDGIPSSLSITVDDDYDRMSPWPVAREGAEIPAVKAEIYFDPDREQLIWVQAGVDS
ncbi:hypothetical protein [Halovivax gelatinilyticus]|uniref:hypothetical protein n=1 Tax=Halovivax gelatinilyticus TaxID=2961597 RepID=UPI0020CA6285|nr:hypothetical protein [Halovivax gelatinilyticus]